MVGRQTAQPEGERVKRKMISVGAAALAVAGGGAALAANGLGTPEEESKAVVEDAAEQLGVDADKLSNALKKALENRVDAAVAAGSLTKEQGEALKARIESQDYPLLGGFRFGHHGGPGGHGFGHLDAAATYLGLTAAELRTQLSDGKTLVDVARAEGKTVDGLVAALVPDETKELDEAVSSGRLTRAQADEIRENTEERLTDMVNGEMPEYGLHRFGGPPSAVWSEGPHRGGTM
jgi:hypothetical protein